jgi:aryl-alcohol dehydrogenase-like predicted oxidoreductase
MPALWSGFASPEATRRYAERFARPDFHRACCGLRLSSIGLGTYLGEPDDATDLAYTAAVERAVALGCNVIDTAINYRFQRSERAVGAALRNMRARGAARREELFLCTKAGFLTPDGEMPANPREYFSNEYFARGVLAREDIVGGIHCLAPRYLEDQLERSRRNLGVETIDLFYLHNPETQLGELSAEAFYHRLKTAFEMLEGKVRDGLIRYYGAATWHGYRRPPPSGEHLSLERVVTAAREAGGPDHHLRFVQAPYNLAMPEIATAATQTVGGQPATLLAAAEALGVAVVASATLMQARLPDPRRALHFVRSTPGVAVALVGMSQVAHVEENLANPT